MKATRGIYKRTVELCDKCKYVRRRNGHSYWCNYSEITGHSRIFENGKRKDVPKGYCDCFCERE